MRRLAIHSCYPFLLVLLLMASGSPANGSGAFGFGIEYLMPSPHDLPALMNQYSEIGATWSKFNGPGTSWNDLEPSPPVHGRHTYRWDNVDRMVLAAQKAGFKNLLVVLKSNSKWGTERRKSRGILETISAIRGMVSTPPASAKHLQHYQDYVLSFVERYDGDGKDDMPGLLYPILDYEIETEAQHKVYWLGTAEEYVTILKAASNAVKKANPAARVILSGMTFWDIFDGGPKSDEEIHRLVAELPQKFPQGDVRHGFGDEFRDQMDFNARILQEKNAFDVVEFHLLSYYTSIPGAVKWIRDQMHKNGYEKPVWMGDAGAVFIPCTNKKGLLAPWSTYTLLSEAPYDNGDRLFEVLVSKKNGYGLRYSDVERWFRAEQASLLVKVLVTAMAEGVEGSNWWTWKDEPALLKANGPGKSWSLCGLMDDDNKEKRPAFYTYKLLIQKIGRFSSVEKLSVSRDIMTYRFAVGNRSIYVVWSTSERPRQPGDLGKSQAIDMRSLLKTPSVTITHIVTDPLTTDPPREVRSPVQVMVTETPIFVE